MPKYEGAVQLGNVAGASVEGQGGCNIMGEKYEPDEVEEAAWGQHK